MKTIFLCSFLLVVNLVFSQSPALKELSKLIYDKQYSIAASKALALIEEDSEDINALYSMSLICYYQDDFIHADEHLNRIFSIEPRNPRAYYLRGLLYYKKKGYAVDDYELLRKSIADFQYACNNNIPEACEYAKKAQEDRDYLIRQKQVSQQYYSNQQQAEFFAIALVFGAAYKIGKSIVEGYRNSSSSSSSSYSNNSNSSSNNNSNSNNVANSQNENELKLKQEKKKIEDYMNGNFTLPTYKQTNYGDDDDNTIWNIYFDNGSSGLLWYKKKCKKFFFEDFTGQNFYYADKTSTLKALYVYKNDLGEANNSYMKGRISCN